MKEIIEFLDEVMEHNEVPIRLRHAALGLKLSIISAQVETPSVGNKKDKKEICPKCENPYPHLYVDGHYECDECGHSWTN